MQTPVTAYHLGAGEQIVGVVRIAINWKGSYEPENG